MKNQFKVGDKVYCPSISSEILTIKVLPSDVMVFDITHSICKDDCGFVSSLKSLLMLLLQCLKVGIKKSY